MFYSYISGTQSRTKNKYIDRKAINRLTTSGIFPYISESQGKCCYGSGENLCPETLGVFG